MLHRMRYAVYPLTLLVLLAVSSVWEPQLYAFPDQERPALAQFNRRDQGRGRRPNQDQMRRNQEQRFEDLCRHLELTEEQKEQARQYFDDHQKNTGEVFKAVRNGDLEREAARDSTAVLLKAYQDQIKSLLTGEQKVKLEEWIKQTRERRGRRPGGTILENLTPEQKA